MLNVVTGIPDLVERWKKQGSTLYVILTVAAGWTVVISTWTGLRPAELLASLARGFGITPLQRWLTTDAPPFIAQSSEHLRSALIAGVVVLILVVGVRMLLLRNGCDRDIEAMIVMSSRACATPWLMLLIAAQGKPFQLSIADWDRQKLLAGAVVAVCALASWVILWVIAHGQGGPLSLFVDGTGRLVRRAWTVCVWLLVVPVGMLLSLIGSALIVLGWLFQAESDSFRDAERRHAQQVPQATGAIWKVR